MVQGIVEMCVTIGVDGIIIWIYHKIFKMDEKEFVVKLNSKEDREEGGTWKNQKWEEDDVKI